MTTYNIAIASAWSKIADTSNTDLLVTFDTPVQVEFATTAADTAPTVMGHLLSRESAITRGVIGTGHVWARTMAGSSPAGLYLVVSK